MIACEATLDGRNLKDIQIKQSLKNAFNINNYLTELKSYPRPTGSMVGRSCRGASSSAFGSATAHPGPTTSPAPGDGEEVPAAQDGPPTEAGDGTV